jgi:hypothetical protein
MVARGRRGQVRDGTRCARTILAPHQNSLHCLAARATMLGGMQHCLHVCVIWSAVRVSKDLFQSVDFLQRTVVRLATGTLYARLGKKAPPIVTCLVTCSPLAHKGAVR